MPIELHNMEEEASTSKIKLALIGKEKNGKSWLAATGRKPVLVHDFDQRAEALAGKKGVYVISYKEPGKGKQPEAAQKFLDVLGKLENSLDLSELGFNVPKGTIIQTNVIDSIQTFGKSFMQYALYCQKDIRREITFGGMKVFLPGGWDAWNSEMQPVEESVLRMLALPCDTTITLHETSEETADSTSEKPRFTGRVGVFPVRYQRLIKYFNEVWRVKLTQSVLDGKSVYLPRVYALPNYEFDAASALKIDSIEEPNIEAMIIKHESRVKGLLPTTAKVLPQSVKL